MKNVGVISGMVNKYRCNYTTSMAIIRITDWKIYNYCVQIATPRRIVIVGIKMERKINGTIVMAVEKKLKKQRQGIAMAVTKTYYVGMLV